MLDKHRVYFGKKFTRRKDGYYVRRDWLKDEKRYVSLLAHRWVWENINGKLSDDLDLHHKNGDPSDNSIENLVPCNRSDHLKKHWIEDNEKRRAQLDAARPLEWLTSDEGRKKVSEKGREVWANRPIHTITCEGCGIEKQFKRWARFCCKACYMKWRWKHRLR